MPVRDRLDALRQRLADDDLDAIIVSDAANRRYLSGFTGSAGVLIISAERALFAVDSRYYDQVQHQAPDFSLERVGYDLVGQLGRLLSSLNARRVGFEANTVTVAQHHEWTAAAQVEWVPTHAVVEKFRAVKDPDELRAIRAAARLTDDVFAHILTIVRPGMTERAIGWEIEKFIREHGAKNWADGPTVGSGPNAALPHAKPTERAVQPGDPIVLDLGAVVDGYFSDMTRTIILGQATPRFEEVYSIVLEAHQRAEDATQVGIIGRAVDKIARDVITEHGFGDYFGHSLGHGVGLQIHESPRASRTSDDVLQSGMTLTVEPGIYLPGWGGVRIEDLVVVGDTGPEVLSRSPKSLDAMVVPI